MFSKDDITRDLRKLGVQNGDILNVKISYKSIGKIEGGISTLINALLEAVGENGTIVTDAFVKSKMYWPWKTRAGLVVDQNTPTYAGIVAQKILEHPKSKRSPHPIQKFAAIGKDADIVLQHNVGSAPYSVLHELCKRGGKNLRIGPADKVTGVGTTHVAIDLLGYKQNMLKSAVDYVDNGNVKTFVANWPTGCKRAFNALLPMYSDAIIGRGIVGDSEAMLTDMSKTLDMEMTLGQKNPNFVMCNDPTCYKCNLTWQHSTGSLWKVIIANLKKGKKKNIENILAALYLSVFKNYQPK